MINLVERVLQSGGFRKARCHQHIVGLEAAWQSHFNAEFPAVHYKIKRLPMRQCTCRDQADVFAAFTDGAKNQAPAGCNSAQCLEGSGVHVGVHHSN